MSRSIENVIRVGVAGVLGGIGGAAGFAHTHEWAVQNGQAGWLGWAVAVVVEGMAVVAGFEIRRDHQRGHHRRLTFPMAVLVVGFGIQMAAQVANARPTVAGWLLAALPALGFLIVVKLLLRGATPIPASIRVPAPLPEEEPEPVTVSRVKLPAGMADKITEVVQAARGQGREPTIEDIRRVVRLPEPMAAQLLAELTTRNGHHSVT